MKTELRKVGVKKQTKKKERKETQVQSTLSLLPGLKSRRRHLCSVSHHPPCRLHDAGLQPMGPAGRNHSLRSSGVLLLLSTCQFELKWRLPGLPVLHLKEFSHLDFKGCWEAAHISFSCIYLNLFKFVPLMKSSHHRESSLGLISLNSTQNTLVMKNTTYLGLEYSMGTWVPCSNK